MNEFSKITYGRWDFIYSQLLPETKQTIKHQPCPACGGKDRFRLFKDWIENGCAICNQCGAGNGFTWLMRVTGESFQLVWKQTLSLINPDSIRSNKIDFIQAYLDRREALLEKKALEQSSKRELQIEISNRAQELWTDSNSGAHPYLDRKNLPSLNTRTSNNCLYVPLEDTEGYLWNLQQIDIHGHKRFLPKGRVQGLFSSIGGQLKDADRVYISEGWATAATIYLETGSASLAAMNAGNLLTVAKSVSERFKDIEIIIAGDDDRHSKINTGRTKATSAALSVGAGLVFPLFCSDCSCSDFNDVAICEFGNRGML